jgi:hypothetical protein
MILPYNDCYDDYTDDVYGTPASTQSFALYRKALYCLRYASTYICIFPRFVYFVILLL